MKTKLRGYKVVKQKLGWASIALAGVMLGAAIVAIPFAVFWSLKALGWLTTDYNPVTVAGFWLLYATMKFLFRV